MTVAAAVLVEAGQPVRLTRISLGEPGPDEVQVALAATGVCHTDISLAAGRLRHALPVVLGHEGAGRVVATGASVTRLAVGDHVVLNWTPACRTCWFCQHDEPYLCQNAERTWQRPHARLADGGEVYAGLGVGGFAEQTVVAESACVRIPSDIPLDEAALLGCAVLTGVGAVRHCARVQPGESVLVVGLGGVGLSAIQGARIAQAGRVIAVDPAPDKRELAGRLGATDVLGPEPDLAKRVRAMCEGRGVDHAIECVGRAELIRAAWSATRRGGHTTVVGLGSPDDSLTLGALELTHFARTISGCIYGSSDPAKDLPFLIECYRSGQLDLASLITRRITLEELNDAFAAMRAGTGVRTVVTHPPPPSI